MVRADLRPGSADGGDAVAGATPRPPRCGAAPHGSGGRVVPSSLTPAGERRRCWPATEPRSARGCSTSVSATARRRQALLQHPLGVAVAAGRVGRVADTYNGARPPVRPGDATRSPRWRRDLAEPSRRAAGPGRRHLVVVEAAAHRAGPAYRCPRRRGGSRGEARRVERTADATWRDPATSAAAWSVHPADRAEAGRPLGRPDPARSSRVHARGCPDPGAATRRGPGARPGAGPRRTSAGCCTSASRPPRATGTRTAARCRSTPPATSTSRTGGSRSSSPDPPPAPDAKGAQDDLVLDLRGV